MREIPPGHYTVTAWHERLGEQRSEITVPERGPARVDLRFR